MTPTSHNPMLVFADFMRAVQLVCAEHHFGAQHPPVSHDEFLAGRQAERTPSVGSLEAKLTSSFLPADRASDRQVDDDCYGDVYNPNDDNSSDSSCSSPSAPLSERPMAHQRSASDCPTG
jgi:hypothetical protein